MLLNLVQDYLCLEEHGKQEQNKSIIGLLSPTEQSLLIDDLVGEYVRRASLCSWHLAIDNLIEEYARTFFMLMAPRSGIQEKEVYTVSRNNLDVSAPFLVLMVGWSLRKYSWSQSGILPHK